MQINKTDGINGKDDQTVELARWRDTGDRLWPFVRYWGLCGASPEALDAMKTLADLLGEQVVGGMAAEDAAAHASNEAAGKLAVRISDRFTQEKVAQRIGPRALDEIRQMIVEEVEIMQAER